MPLVKNKSNLNQVQEVVNKNAQSQISRDVVKLDNGSSGTFTGSVSEPLTGSAVVVAVGTAVIGGEAIAYFNGDVLSKSSFIDIAGDPINVSLLLGTNTLNVLCILGFIFDKRDNSCIVTISEE